MSLLIFEGVSKRYTAGRLECPVLHEVDLSMEPGELVAVWGERRSGRSTLLRIAAGIEPPDSGHVRFRERDLQASRGHALGDGIGYCRPFRRDREERVVLEEIMVGPRTRGLARSDTKARAHACLDRVGASGCMHQRMSELDGTEAVRVSIARALVLDPALLLIDEPVTGVDLLARDEVLTLLRSLADEGIAVLMTVADSTALTEADRALRISGGRLGGSVNPQLAPVSDLDRHRQARG